MTKSIVRLTLYTTATAAILCASPRAYASDNGDMLKQSEKLLKQAWNPGGDAPSDDQRADLLKQAIDLAKKEPDHRLAGTKMRAIESMQAALEEVKAGNATKAGDDMQDADRQLRAAIEIAESH